MSVVLYEHWRPDIDQPFYVGSGSRQRAGARSGHRHSARYRAVLAELTILGLKPEVRIISQHQDEAAGCAAEAERIRFWREQGVELVNQHNRGIRRLSPEARDRMRLSPGRPLFGDAPIPRIERVRQWRARKKLAKGP